MYIVHRTLRFHLSEGGPSYKDHYELCDTLEEAQKRIETYKHHSYVPDEMDMYCWSISEVVDASEPHWIEKKEVWGSDK